MDEDFLSSLRTAYQQSPDNLTLRMMLAKGLWENGDVEAAYDLACDDSIAATQEQEQLLIARIALAHGDFAKALAVLTADTPPSLILKAHACLLKKDYPAGQNYYRQAVSANPTLEDPQLDSELSVPAAATAQNNVIGLRLVSPPSGDEDDDGPYDLFKAETVNSITFSDIGGLHEVKKVIHRKIILPFQKPGLFEKFKRRAGGGVLLYGPPGCGKTLIARATAGECKAQFYNISIADILDMYIGNSEKKLNALFEQARRTAPAVLFFDEFEGLAGKRNYAGNSPGSQVISQFLSEMDGFANNNGGILVLGATNVPWAVDSAFRRPGRFDRVVFVPPPDRAARQAILSIHLQGRPLAKDIDVAILAQKTSGYSGADLQNLIETACDIAIEDTLEAGREIPVSMAHLKDALHEIKPTTTEWLTTARNYARYSNEGGQYDDVVEFLKQHGK